MQNAAPDSKFHSLHNRYEIRSAIGRGGAGEVFTAWDTQLGRTVAIKRLRKEGLKDDIIEGAWQEAMRLAAIRHSNIVTVYDMGLDNGTPCIVMEFVNGETIGEQVSKHGVMHETEFSNFARQALDGLLAAHHAGLLHCDLKPANLMLARLPSGKLQLKILDFGIARFLAAPDFHAEEGSTVTGSLHCIAPEILNRDPADDRSDLYSLGCVFYYALSGCFPFNGAGMADVIAAHLNHEVIDLGAYRPDLSPGLSEWVMALINRWPQDRYNSAEHALSGLQAIEAQRAQGNSLPAEPIPNPAPQRGKMGWVLGAIVSMGMLMAVVMTRDGRWRAASPDVATMPKSEIVANPIAPPPFPQVHEAPPEPLAPAAPHSDGNALPARDSSTAVPVLAERAAPRTLIAPPAAPPPEIVLRFHGSNTIGAKLLPALLETFLQKQGAVEVKRQAGGDREEMLVEGRFPDSGWKAIEVSAHGSKTAFEDLASRKCDVGIASRQIKPEEATACAGAGLGDLQSAACEHVLGLDGIAILANRDNPVEILSVQQIAEIFGGKIEDWSQVGGKAGPIHLYARDGNSGTFDTFKTLVLGALPLSNAAKRLEDSEELSDRVSTDPEAIGFAGLPFVRNAKLIAVSENGAAPLLATRFTVATEDYALSRRLFIYAPEHVQHPWTSKFLEFAMGAEGQEIVSKIGFVKQTIDLERPTIPTEAPPAYLIAAQKAERLSVNLRFKKRSIELDNKSLRDLERIGELLAEPRTAGRKLLLFGFADNVGTAASNLKISKERAQAVGKQLSMRGIDPAIVTSFGSALPVADNASESGRDKNRRVEVWLR